MGLTYADYQNGTCLMTQSDALQPIPVHVLDDCTIDLAPLFPNIEPESSDQ